jgi:molecular chaperone GrpE
MEKKKNKKEIEFEQKIGELTADLQRTRADFENFRKRNEMERSFARDAGRTGAVLSLLPVIDNIERAIAHIPDDLKNNKWVQGIDGLSKSLEKSIEDMKLKKIDANPGTVFNPEFHDAIQFNEAAIG